MTTAFRFAILVRSDGLSAVKAFGLDEPILPAARKAGWWLASEPFATREEAHACHERGLPFWPIATIDKYRALSRQYARQLAGNAHDWHR